MFILKNLHKSFTILQTHQFARNVVKQTLQQILHKNETNVNFQIQDLINEGKSDEQILQLILNEKDKEKGKENQLPKKSKQGEITKADNQIESTQQKVQLQERAKHSLQKLDEDKSFKELASKDRDQTQKELDDYEERPKKGDSREKTYIMKTKEDSFKVQNQKFQKLNNLLELKSSEEKAQLQKVLKEEFFLEKKLQEDNLERKLYQEKKDREKELREVYKSLKNMDWEDKPNLEEKHEQEQKALKKLNSLNLEERIEKIMNINMQTEEQLGKKKDQYIISKIRTKHNIETFIYTFLFEQKEGLRALTKGEEIEINEVQTNPACTVVYIFWEIKRLWDLDNTESDAKTKLKEKQSSLTKPLERFAKYMRGQMCKTVGLRFAPDIRFRVSQKRELYANLKEEATQQIQEVALSSLLEQYKEGTIERKIPKKLYDQELRKLESKATEYAFTNVQEQLKPKRYKINPDKRKHKNKNNETKAQKFWNKI